MKPSISEMPCAERRVELWTPWGVLRPAPSEDQTRKTPRKPLPGAWAPPAAAAPARSKRQRPSRLPD